MIDRKSRCINIFERFFCFVCLISYRNIEKIHCKKILHKYDLREMIFVGASCVFPVLFHLDVNKIQSNSEIGRPLLFVSNRRMKWEEYLALHIYSEKFSFLCSFELFKKKA